MFLTQKIRLPGTTPGEQSEIIGPLPEGRFTNLASILNVSLPYIFSIAGVLLLAYLIWGGFNYLTSMGDPKKAEVGKSRITHAVIGFFIIFVAYWLVQIIDFVFKLGIYTSVSP